jgi:hypothetical protein
LLPSLVTRTCLLLILDIIMMIMVISQYFNAHLWIPLQAANKVATQEISMSIAVNSAILKSANINRTHQDVKVSYFNISFSLLEVSRLL